MPISVALLGSGVFASAAYLPALAETPGIHVHTMWSRSPASVSSFHANAAGLLANHAAIRTLSGDDGFSTLLADPAIDAVILVLPILAQPALIRAALQAGKHVISEKPVGGTVQAASELIAEYDREYRPRGLVWYVAENWAHEPAIRRAAEIVQQPELGAVLYYQARMENPTVAGSKYHQTSWRTVPEYQGGFLLDGGVHLAALIRVILPGVVGRVISTTALHRAHLLPHDTITALLLPPTGSGIVVEPHGGPLPDLPAAAPIRPGQSAPSGTLLITFAVPNAPAESRPPNGLWLVCEHGTLNVELLAEGAKREFRVTLTGGQDAGVHDYQETFPFCGVAVELARWAEAVDAAKQGRPTGALWGEPADAMWDLLLIETCLESNGKEIDLEAYMDTATK